MSVAAHVIPLEPEESPSSGLRSDQEPTTRAYTHMHARQKDQKQRTDQPRRTSSGTLSPIPSWRTQVEALRIENARLHQLVCQLQPFRAMAYRDPLTGLWNRRYFDERFAEELGRANRAPVRCFTVMAIDINELKRINDRDGHRAGDRAIAWAAGFLRQTFRAHDIVCRTGGDEFYVLFPDIDRAAARAIVRRLKECLAQARRENPAGPGLSVGTATFPGEARTPELLMEIADHAMYTDKREQKAARIPRTRLSA